MAVFLSFAGLGLPASFDLAAVEAHGRIVAEGNVSHNKRLQVAEQRVSLGGW